MSLSKVGSGATYDNAGSAWNTTNLTKDTGTASGDLAIIAVCFYEDISDEIVNTPTGFTAHGSLVFDGTGSTETRIDLFTRAIDGTEGASWAVTRAGSATMFASAMLLTLRGDDALTVASITDGTPAAAVTTVDAPSVSGTNGQGLLSLFALTDPGGTYTPPGGMTLGIAAPENTSTGRMYYETLAATEATGVRTLSWTTSRDAVGISMLIDGATSGSPVTEYVPPLPQRNRRMSGKYLRTALGLLVPRQRIWA